MMTGYRPRLIAVTGAFALLSLTQIDIAQADHIVNSWKATELPAPPELQSITVDSAHTALLILDMYANSCVDSQRPRCVKTLPAVQQLLATARANKLKVIYSGSPPGMPAPKIVDALAPLKDEPMVRGPADKWLGSDLEKILTAGGIKSVIVVGTSAEGAVLYTGTGASLRNLATIVPVDGISSVDPFGELLTVWQFKNGPAIVTKNVTLTRTDLIAFR